MWARCKTDILVKQYTNPLYQANGELVQSKSPSMQQLEKYMQSSLAVDHDGDRELEFGLGWDQSAFDDWLRRLLPKPFEWLDMRFGRPESGTFHWVLLRKNRSRLFVVKRDVTTGVQVSAVKGTTGRKFTDYSVRIGQCMLSGCGSLLTNIL